MSEKITKSINIGILAVVFVFLAVIVIPRISAQEGNIPRPAQIVSVVADSADCDISGNTSSNITVFWRPFDQGSTHKLFVYDSEQNELEVNGLLGGYPLNPNNLSINLSVMLDYSHSCGDSYFVSIETTKNNQTVLSSRAYFTWGAETSQDKITYKLDIPCAIDRLQIIVPNPADQNYIGQYKARCNSNAFFDEVTGIYHFKKNEGYYINLEFTNDLENKVINLSEIDSVVLEYYNENTGNVCFYRKMESMYNAENKYVSKISYVQPNESKEFANNNMTGLINSCGLNTRIGIRARVQLVSGEMIATQNNGLIKTIMIDSDNSNQTAQENRNKVQSNQENNIDPTPKDILQEREDAENVGYLVRSTPREDPTSKETITERPISNEILIVKRSTSPIINNTQYEIGSKHQNDDPSLIKDSKTGIKDSDLFLEIDNSVKKIKSIDKIFQENNIDSKKVVGEIVLDTNSNNPEYVFEVKEKRKLFGFIPIGSKIVQKKISATVDIKE